MDPRGERVRGSRRAEFSHHVQSCAVDTVADVQYLKFRSEEDSLNLPSSLPSSSLLLVVFLDLSSISDVPTNERMEKGLRLLGQEGKGVVRVASSGYRRD